MRTIHLPQNYIALVDDEDYDDLIQYNWRPRPGRYTVYAQRSTSRLLPGPRTTVSMHRHILKPKDGQDVDHINRNGLDNRRANIRIVTKSFNSGRRKISFNSPLGYKGVTQIVQAGHVSYQARISVERERIFLGLFETPEEAARIYDEAAVRAFGSTTALNFGD